MKRKNRKSGVPKGYKHNWKYLGKWHEVKTGPGTWKIDFKATKGRRVKGSHRNEPKRGTKIRWYIRGYQDAIKTSRGTYQTRLRGTKKLVWIKRR